MKIRVPTALLRVERERWRITGDSTHQFARIRVAQLAERQQGRITRAQLGSLGVGPSTIRDWASTGYLHRRLPAVYAVGSPARSTESDLFEAVLYAGPGAMLSHASAARWLEMIDRWPPLIHVSTPRRRRSIAEVLVHSRRVDLTRTVHAALPVTTIADTLLDLAAAGQRGLVRRSLARLDYQRRLDTSAIRNACGRGRPGSRTLRRELDAYDPLQALTRSRLEVAFLGLGLPRPDAVNVTIHGVSCDVVYEQAKLVVMLDGVGNHRSSGQVRRDLRDAFTLRRYGWLVLRYGEEQIGGHPAEVRTEVLAELQRRAISLP